MARIIEDPIEIADAKARLEFVVKEYVHPISELAPRDWDTLYHAVVMGADIGEMAEIRGLQRDTIRGYLDRVAVVVTGHYGYAKLIAEISRLYHIELGKALMVEALKRAG